MKNFTLILLSSVMGVAAGIGYVSYFVDDNRSHLNGEVAENENASIQNTDRISASNLEELQSKAERFKEALRNGPYLNKTVSGHYLSARFAQTHHDWKKAGDDFQKILKRSDYNDIELTKRAMVLAMGAGEYNDAMHLAKKVEELSQGDGDQSALADLFMAIKGFKSHDYEAAQKHLMDMPEGSLSEFIMPLLYAWTSASNGQYDVQDLTGNAVHIYHAIMISDYMDQHDQVATLLGKALQAPDLPAQDIERIADIYAHIGEHKKALALYQTIAQTHPSAALNEKISTLESGGEQKMFKRIQSAGEGVAHSMYDMARLLAQDYNDESARVFVQMALYLHPDFTKAKFLLAHLASRNGLEHEAIALYKSVTPDSDPERYIEAQRLAAELLEDSGKTEDAIALLEPLFALHKDIEALIQIGDIYRRGENFEQAVTYYNQAAAALGESIPAHYWHLHYARGMSYEQLQNWDMAEQDLQDALRYQPDHPFLLNYLGYSWADQGTNLDEALSMIERAAALRPTDGYITDSLGWVLYRLGRYEEAIAPLEQAVQLRPYDPVINDHLGDAYWRVGRTNEARFQWLRAKNHTEESSLKAELENKLAGGLPAISKEGTMVHAENVNPVEQDVVANP